MKSSEIPRVCGVEGCTHEDHEGEEVVVFIHGRCHMSAPTFTKLVGDIAIVECAVCRKEIVRLDLVP
jgi:hypothetical protein